MEIGQSAGKSYAYLLGVYLGDGCVTQQMCRGVAYPVFRLNTIDEDFALATKAALETLTSYKVGVCKHGVKKSSKPNYALRCGDPVLCAMLRIETACKTRLPSLTVDENKALIVGLMDSEGFVAANKSNPTNRKYFMGYKSCDAWVPDFISLLQSIGLKIGKRNTEKPLKSHYKAPTRFNINMQSWVDSGLRFNIKRKQDRVDAWAEFGAYEQRGKFPRKLTPETTRQTAEKQMI